MSQCAIAECRHKSRLDSTDEHTIPLQVTVNETPGRGHIHPDRELDLKRRANRLDPCDPGGAVFISLTFEVVRARLRDNVKICSI